MRLIIFFIFAVTIILSWCSSSFAGVSGSLEWDYAHYQADEGGTRVFDSSSFAQRYTALLSRQGVFMGGRGGEYDFAIGGEWWGLNSDIQSNGVNNSSNVNNGKVLYLGELLFAPGGLPFRFKMYGRDLTSAKFERNLPRGSFDDSNLLLRRPNVLTPDIVTNVNDGERREFGASMVLGIKNGSYLGRYRDTLAHLPKIFFDYREIHVKDLTSWVPQHYVERELAFVSLNKKHNWFHYRFMEYADKLNALADYGETSYLLGTVDQYMRREWINLTNWIQLSTDMRYTYIDNYQNTQTTSNEYAINLFVRTKRQNWRSVMFSDYSRFEVRNRLQRSLVVPIYASGETDRNNSWRYNLTGIRAQNNQPFALTNTETADNNVYTSLRWETGKVAKYISAPAVEVEMKAGDRGEGRAFRAFYEYYPNRSLAQASGSYDLFSRLSLAYFEGMPEQLISTSSTDDSYFEGTAKFDLAKQLHKRVRAGFGSFLLLGSGKISTSTTNFIRPVSLERLKASSSQIDNIDGNVWRAELILFLDHVGLSRVSNRLELGGEYQDVDGDSVGQYYLDHRLRYAVSRYLLDIKSKLLIGDNLSQGVSSRTFSATMAQSEFDGMSLSHDSLLTYTPNREHYLSGKLVFEWRLPDYRDGGYLLSMAQEYRYAHYLQFGIKRRLFELKQFLNYERVDSQYAEGLEAISISGLANYYPTNWSRLGCRVGWMNDFSLGSGDTGFGLYADLNFSKLSVGVLYEYGMRAASDNGNIMGRDEQRWNISIRKTF